MHSVWRHVVRRLGMLLGLAALAALSPTTSSAQSWPARPILMIAPYPPAGGVDAVARLVAEKLSTRLGQPITVDNRPGAGATVGGAALARSAPDGYTLMLGSIVDYAIAPFAHKSLSFEMQRDFIAVIEVGFGTIALIVSADLPVRSLQELIALAKAKPGSLNFATTGIGNIVHLSGEMFKQMAGVDI